MSIETNYASRKFILCCAGFVAGLGLFIANKLTASDWTSFTTWLIGLYLTGNVAHAALVNKAQK